MMRLCVSLARAIASAIILVIAPAVPAQGMRTVGSEIILDSPQRAADVVMRRVVDVTDAALSPAGQVFIADRKRGQIHVLDRQLGYVRGVGTMGSEPGQYRALAAVAAVGRDGFVAVERYLRRLDLYEAKDGTYTLVRSIKLPFEPYDICPLTPSTFLVLGLSGGHKLHVIGLDGRATRSFAPMDAAIHPKVASESAIKGHLLCRPAADEVLLAAEVFPVMETYRLRDGTRLHADTLRPFRPLAAQATERGGVSFSSGPGGFSAVGQPFAAGAMRIVQAEYRARTDSASRDTVLTYTFSRTGQVHAPIVSGERLLQLDDSTALVIRKATPLALELVRVRASRTAVARPSKAPAPSAGQRRGNRVGSPHP